MAVLDLSPDGAVPDRAQLVDAARAIAPELTAASEQAETERRLPDASVSALGAAGLWRILTPRTFGGWEAGLRAQVDTLAVTAAADPAAGWVQMVINAHAWIVASFEPDCQEEVFAGGPDTRIPGALAAQGRARRDGDNFVLDGRWQFASGVDHGDWLLIGATTDGPERALHLVVPKGDLEVDDTWFTLGLRGTGSKDLVAEGVAVPAHRVMPTRMLFDGMSPHGEHHATNVNRLPVLVCLSVQLAGAVVGMAAGALQLHIERTRTRREVYTGRSKAENVGTQLRVAESSAELDAATALVQRAADRCDEVASTGVRLTVEERAVLKWHAAYAVELARRATDRLFAASGAHAVYDDSVLQRRYRDLTTACHHAIVDLDGTAEMVGRVLLGLDPGTVLL